MHYTADKIPESLIARPFEGPIDDFGDGKYDFMGIAERVPLHAEKAEEFAKQGDTFNALQHARECLKLCAQGWQGTEYYHRALKIREQLG